MKAHGRVRTERGSSVHLEAVDPSHKFPTLRFPVGRSRSLFNRGLSGYQDTSTGLFPPVTD